MCCCNFCKHKVGPDEHPGDDPGEGHGKTMIGNTAKSPRGSPSDDLYKTHTHLNQAYTIISTTYRSPYSTVGKL